MNRENHGKQMGVRRCLRCVIVVNVSAGRRGGGARGQRSEEKGVGLVTLFSTLDSHVCDRLYFEELRRRACRSWGG